MKMLTISHTAWIALCVVLSLTACKKKNDATPEKEAKITGSPSDAPISLMPKWIVGKRYVMRMESDQSTEMPNMQPAAGGQPGTNLMRMENRFAQEYALVATNAADGKRGVEMEILAIELEAGTGNQMMNYSSRNKVAPTGGAVGEAFDQIIGAKIDYLIGPDNKVLEISGIEELIQRMEAPADGAAPAGRRRGRGATTAMARGVFNEEVLKQMIEFTHAPTNATRIGESWTDTRDVKVPTLSALVVMTTNTLRGWQERDGRKCARVDFTGTMMSKSGDAANVGGMQVKIENGSINGQYWFAPEEGMAIDVSVDQNYKMLMTGVPQAGRNGENMVRDMTATVNQRVTIKLLEITAP